MSLRASLVALCLSWSVAQAERDPSAVALHVLDADGRGVSDAVVLLIDAHGSPVTQFLGDKRGLVSLPAIAPGSRLSVTTPSGWAVVGSNLGQVAWVRVNSTCAHLGGRGGGDIAPGALVWMEGQGRAFAFGAVVRGDYSFDACVPEGLYRITPDPPLIAPPAFVMAPTTVTVTASLPETASRTPPIDDRVLASVSELLQQQPRVLAVGEPNHGSAEVLTQRFSTCRELAAVGAVSSIALEAGAAEVFPLDDYVHGRLTRAEVSAAVTRLGYWVWDTEDFLRELDAVRQWNLEQPSIRQLSLFGIDVQGAARSREFLAAHGSAESVALARVLGTAGSLESLTWIGRPALRAAAQLLERIRAGAAASDLRLALVTTSLLSQVRQAEAAGLAQDVERDAGMASMVQALLQRSSGGVCLLAHNAHISRDPSEGVVSMGARLAKELGSRYVAVGVMVGRGVVRAWDADNAVGVIENEIEPLVGSLEAALLSRDDTSPTLFRVALQSPRMQRWLDEVHTVGEFGARFPGPGRGRLRRLAAAFDAILFVPVVSPTRPTPSGIRLVNP